MKDVLTAGKDLVSIRLVPYIPDQDVLRRIVNIVQCNGEFGNAEAGTQMPFFYRYDIDDEIPDFLCE